MSLGMEFNWAFLMLHDIIVEKMLYCFKENYLSFIYNKTEKRGGLRFLTGCTQGGGGGAFRCVLCATRGVGGGGGLKIRKKCVCN